MKRFFLQLVRFGIGHPGDDLCGAVDWNDLWTLARQQGLSAVVLDGIERLPEELHPSKVLMMQWIGETLQHYEYRYDLYRRTIAEMAGFYNEHGLKMMVLKGYACSLDWPKPEHRPCGDIDIWQFGMQKVADALLSKEKRLKIDNSHHHHTVFCWGGFAVENHYDFINIHHHKSHKEFEEILKELGKDDTLSVSVMGEKVYLPSPNLHALFLLKHLTLHFASGEITFRQLLDWAFFVEKHGENVDWQWLYEVLERFGLTTITNIFNAICVEDFGFEPRLFHQVQFNPYLKDRVINEMFCSTVSNDQPRSILPRVIWKYKRWKSSEWKHKLCYKESMFSAFWSGVWGHLIKPSSI